mgnify:CR=1 FL=1
MNMELFFFNEKHEEIIPNEWKKYVVDSIACNISIAECEREGFQAQL